MGFPLGERFEGKIEQAKKLHSSFERKIAFMHEHKVPIWNGEFGPLYASTSDEDYEKINNLRYKFL